MPILRKKLALLKATSANHLGSLVQRCLLVNFVDQGLLFRLGKILL